MRIIFIKGHLNLGWNERRGQLNSTCFGVGTLSSRSEGRGHLRLYFPRWRAIMLWSKDVPVAGRKVGHQVIRGGNIMIPKPQ